MPINMKTVHQYFELKENTMKNTIEMDNKINPMKRYTLFAGLDINIDKNDKLAKVIKRGHKFPAYAHEEKLQCNASKLKRIR
jgi:hypothetical protein